MMRKQGVMSTTNDLFPTYLLEFLWRRRFGNRDLLEAMIGHIAEQYIPFSFVVYSFYLATLPLISAVYNVHVLVI